MNSEELDRFVVRLLSHSVGKCLLWRLQEHYTYIFMQKILVFAQKFVDPCSITPHVKTPF